MTATSDRKAHARSLFAGIAGDYDRWAQLLSFGQDRRWHDLMIEAIAPAADREGAVVADIATGTAAVAIALARRYPCRVVGVDQSPEMLAGGARRVEAAGLTERIELVEGQAERLPAAAGSVDALTHTYLLRYVDDPPATLAALAGAVRPGGMMASLEFGVPRGAALPAWRLWTRVGLPLFGAPGGARVDPHRPVPRPEHRAVLERASPGRRPRLVGRGRDGADPRAPAQPRRGRRHLGHAGGLTAQTPAGSGSSSDAGAFRLAMHPSSAIS